jgi:hypothetical protein
MGDPYGQMGNMQQPMANPFRQSMMMMPQMTGFPNQNQPFGNNSWAQAQNGRMVPQTTGFLQPQQTQFMQPQQTGFMPQQPSPFMQPQSTGFLQPNSGQPQRQQSMGFANPSPGAQPMMPQSTGPNPFRQSMFPQSTGSPFQPMASPPMSGSMGLTQNSVTPAPTNTANSVNIAKPLSVQPTGSKNPFALPSDHERKPSPQPSGPTLFQLSQMKSSTMPTGGNSKFDSVFGSSTNGNNALTNEFGALSMNGPRQSHLPAPAQSNTVSGTGGGSSGTAMSDLASAFTFSSNNDANKQTTFNNGMSAFNTGLSSASELTGQATGFTASSAGLGTPGGSAFGGAANTLQPQPTGFAGSTVKPFKPSSNFGSTLVDNLAPLPSSQTGTPVGNMSSNKGAAFGQAFPTSPLSSQQTGFNPFGAGQNTGMTNNNDAPSNGSSSFMSAFGQPNQTGTAQTNQNSNAAFMNAFGTANNNWMTAGQH